MRSIGYCSVCGQQIAAHYGPNFQLPLPCYVCGEIVREPVQTVVAVLVPLLKDDQTSVLLVERLDPVTLGQLALPAGYQNAGETWQQAAEREVFEETGVRIDPNTLSLNSIHTVETTAQTINLIMAESAPIEHSGDFVPDGVEVSRVIGILAPTDLAFPLHTAALTLYFSQHNVAAV